MSWVAVVGGVISAGTVYYGAQQQKKAAKRASGPMNELAGLQAQNARTLQPYVGDFYARAKAAYDPAFSYYRSLASGDRNQILNTLSPELANISGRYRSLLGASRELNPRSGAGAAYNTDLAYRSADDQQALINRERSAAYGQLGNLAGIAGGLGAGAAGAGSNAAMGAGSLFGGAYNLQRGAAADQAGAYGQIADAIMGIYDHGNSQGWWGSSSKSSGGGAKDLDILDLH